MNTKQASEYLASVHKVNVQPATVMKWLRAGHVEGIQATNRRWEVTESAIDRAIEKAQVPRKAGRKRVFTKEQRKQMCDMCEKHTLKQVAKMFGCDESYVSLVRRGLR